ncbi:MAG: sodium:solute symporter [Bacteroidetes bacterium]|nr:sodium:solute symporter [Bacteroidota bacterium]MBS1933755.1 sodium:solute symporter [Bacteroidota bacterium]
MSTADWIVLIVTLLCVIIYGLYKSRSEKNLDGYFLCERSVPWYIVLLSIMGTQASAVTFLSAPGQAYTDGMRFVQYYFGLPLAMVVLCITFVPVFHKLKIYTAYEFLEKRFDLKTRTLTSFLFLVQRGLSTGISISAPSIILSSLLGWDIFYTNIFMGGLLIIYTVTGGAKAVAYTQQLQLIIIFSGMIIAGYMVVHLLPAHVGFFDALHVGGKAGKLNVITTGFTKKGFNWNDRYNLLSGVIGGFFLALSYFGTDQSQVGRYITAKSENESKLGLLMNGLVKVPMQFLILLVGVLVFAFYQFTNEPVFFNQSQLNVLAKSKYKDSLIVLQKEYNETEAKKIQQVNLLADKQVQKDVPAYIQTQLELKAIEDKKAKYRHTIKRWLDDKDVKGESNDTNYIFLRFVVDYLPKGLVGLLIAVIFLAAWSSIAAALNSLSAATIIDFHKRFSKKELSEKKEYDLSRWYTLLWGIFCIVVAQLAYNIGNSLIEAVNVLGSLFYGVILGIFLVAFYMKKISGNAVFCSAVIIEALVITIHVLNQKGIMNLSFLWLNAVGAIGVIILSALVNPLINNNKKVGNKLPT